MSAIKLVCFAVGFLLTALAHTTAREETWNSKGTRPELPQITTIITRGNVTLSDVAKSESRLLCVDVNKGQSKPLLRYRPASGRMLSKKPLTGSIRNSIAIREQTLDALLCSMERRMMQKRESVGLYAVLSCQG